MPAVPPPTIRIWCLAVVMVFLFSCRSGALVDFVPGAVATQDVADVGEALLPQQARGDRRPVTAGAVHDRGLGGIQLAEPRGQLSHRDSDRIRDGPGRDLT